MFAGNFGLVQVGNAPLGDFHSFREGPRWSRSVGGLGPGFGRWRRLSRGELLSQRADFLHQIAVLRFQAVQAFDDLL
jgi:hypothetical protein